MVRGELAEGLLLLANSQISLNKIDRRKVSQAFEEASELVDSLPNDDSFSMKREQIHKLTLPIQRFLSKIDYT
jgi:hypothetical protein